MTDMVRIVVEIGTTSRTEAAAVLTANDVRIMHGLDHLKHCGQGIDQIRARWDLQFERLGHDNEYSDGRQTAAAEVGNAGVEFDLDIERR